MTDVTTEHELLRYVLDHAEGPADCVDLERFAEDNGYSREDVADAVSALQPTIQPGAITQRAWYRDRDAVVAAIEERAGDVAAAGSTDAG